MDLSIIIVNYKTKDLTLACIESVFSSTTSYNYEIILIDNASNDGTIQSVNEQFPQVVTITNTENVGFSRANNQGIRIAKGSYVLLLNSDTIVQRDTLDIMLRFMDENPIVGASGCKIVLPDGSLDKACKRGFPTPSASFYYAFGFAKLFPKIHRFNQYQLGYLDADQQYPIDSLVGAFMLVRRETIEHVGMLDEEFFMYGEDIDWCYRIKEAGWVNYYYPKTQIVHHKGASSRRKPYKIIYEFHRAMILFHNKHYRKKYSWFTNAMVYIGVGVKFALSLAQNKLRPTR
ncbi:N-acetylglucosaminyl-diphospho-decaprenol L-rhamnosyltransferase [Paenibacillus allorhizoplanae]|uniref:N-acetylglucosaminyl-diphospho-decaprenol L-rhamnosyltransferase n=1 Tax=Paenibacillus allorhizoplanae TaxID=2905648 RepID=A0ABM9CCU9_9BACL|nr:glycosyltransferase family 2 protein [Paenibacillus allorhizoplanae]CAH1208383.1 N-acetylglucosaminyl-diphospho-decaprenol L-rhamnosyltransferase [Paenibacillus allorhizoplanae]